MNSFDAVEGLAEHNRGDPFIGSEIKGGEIGQEKYIKNETMPQDSARELRCILSMFEANLTHSCLKIFSSGCGCI